MKSDNIYLALFKEKIEEEAVQRSISSLERVSTITMIYDNLFSIKFDNIPVSLTIYRLDDNTYKLRINGSKWTNKLLYFNDDDGTTIMSVDRIFFYLRYFMEKR